MPLHQKSLSKYMGICSDVLPCLSVTSRLSRSYLQLPNFVYRGWDYFDLIPTFAEQWCN